MNQIKQEIESIKEQLRKKELEYESEQQSIIRELKENLNTKTVSANSELKSLKQNRVELDRNIKKLEEKVKSKDFTLKNVLSTATNSVKEFIKKRKELEKQSDTIKQLELENNNILNQQINISNLSFIQELSLLQLDINIQEFEEKKISKDEVYRGLFDVSYKLKFGVKLDELTYDFSKDKKTLYVYNVNIITNLDKTPKVKKKFSELRTKEKKGLVTGFDGWKIDDENKNKTSEYDKNVEDEIRKKIDDNRYIKNNLGIIENSFNKAVEQYLHGITNGKFKIKILENKDAKGLSYEDCFKEYNSRLEKQLKPIEAKITSETIESELENSMNSIAIGN